MKIRSDFVTNSSSSSFMINYENYKGKRLVNAIYDSKSLLLEVNTFLKEILNQKEDFLMNKMPSYVKHFFTVTNSNGKEEIRSYKGVNAGCVLVNPKIMGIAFVSKIMNRINCASPNSVWNDCVILNDLFYTRYSLYVDAINNPQDYKKEQVDLYKKRLEMQNAIMRRYRKKFPQFEKAPYNEKRNENKAKDRDFSNHFCQCCLAIKGDRKIFTCHKRNDGIRFIDEVMNSDAAILTNDNFFDRSTMEAIVDKFKIKVCHYHMG